MNSFRGFSKWSYKYLCNFLHLSSFVFFGRLIELLKLKNLETFYGVQERDNPYTFFRTNQRKADIKSIHELSKTSV